MQKTTVLAKLRLTVRFTPDGISWLRQNIPETSLTEGDGTAFLHEHGHSLTQEFLDSAKTEIRDYFSERGVPHDFLPDVELAERYRGSLVVEAAVIMFTTIGTAYTVLKGVSELPDIADGLVKLKQRILNNVRPKIERSVQDAVWNREPRFVRNLPAPTGRQPPPPSIVDLDLTIDARPLTALTPAKLKAHKIHIGCAVSRESFTMENLDEEPLRDVRLGLFSSPAARHQWSFGDAFVTTIPMLSGGQTMVKPLSDFCHQNGDHLELPDTSVFVDCWVQDNSGIYLFNFYLEPD